MGVYPTASSILQGPSVPINNDIQLHRLFERNEKVYPEHMAVMHEGMWKFVFKTPEKGGGSQTEFCILTGILSVIAF